ncbi:MAG: hypothetical protein WA609_16315 [Terriglobales bacterium]
MFTLTIFNRTALTALLFASSFALAQAPEAPPAKPLPPGPALPKIKAACLQCHNASRITDAHFSRTQWSDELDKMAGLGAVVPDADRKAFLDYLTVNFGPQKGAGKKTPKSGDAK